MGQLSDPYQQGEDETGIVVSGLPGDLLEPDPATPSTDAAGDEEVPPEEGGSGDSMVYDLDDWSEIERQAIADRLREAGVPHGWEETRLLIAAVDEALVENVLDIVEGESGAEGGEPLDADRDQIAYDVSELEDDALDLLVDKLRAAGVDHAWGDEELYVYADDEDAADTAFEAAQYPDELDAEDDEPAAGAASAELLGDVFVAADRLSHDGEDVEGTASLLDIAVTIDDLDPPYGMGARDWERVCGGVGDLSDLLVTDTDADDVDPDVHDEKVRASARDLRSILRPLV